VNIAVDRSWAELNTSFWLQRPSPESHRQTVSHGVALQTPTALRHAGPLLETVVSDGSGYCWGTTMVARSRLMRTVVRGEAKMFSMVVTPPTLNPRACAPAATGTVTGP
jgi:hypothetical protein